ncbi:glycosyltransferase family 4 protein [Castellaniella sp. GW247-6E4]|uniref:glycosyltransferase family 4 protein n=1 Tax=Castellaniella sp. GW247-6E4 TaxID=3140380 RepID=UPI003315D207
MHKKKILHICVSAHFTEGLLYQDNMLAICHRLDGHEVIVISDCQKYEDGCLVETPEEDIVLSDGVRLIRISFANVINRKITNKIRYSEKLKKIIINERPDIILHHGISGFSLLSLRAYKKFNSNCKIYLDTHKDFNNSPGGFLSTHILHGFFNKILLKSIAPFVEKILCVSLECQEFTKEVYGVRDDKTELYPLGGLIVSHHDKLHYREVIRERHGIGPDELVVCHSGKLSKDKRTLELITALGRLKGKRIKLIILGSISDDYKDEIMKPISEDKRIIYLEWVSGGDLIKYLSAADLYLQPGTQSATMQAALCSGTPVAIYPYKSHIRYLEFKSGFFVENIEDIMKVLSFSYDNRNILEEMSRNAYACAEALLDYRRLARRVYS